MLNRTRLEKQKENKKKNKEKLQDQFFKKDKDSNFVKKEEDKKND